MPSEPHLFERVRELCSSADSEVLLVAPFAKVKIVQQLIDAIPRPVPVKVVTRWRLDELASGVSDLSVWDAVSARDSSGSRSTMYLVPSLHAKYFATGDRVLLGSTNLTGAGLGIVPRPNLELLVPVGRNHSGLEGFEAQVFQRAEQVSYSLHARFAALIDDLPETAAADLLGDEWIPRFRSPEDLWVACNDLSYPYESRRMALWDVADLGLPLGLDEVVFREAVSVAFCRSDLVLRLASWVGAGRRFGELRAWLTPYLRGTEDAGLATQTTIRWVVVFASEIFEVARPNYSEIIRLREP